MKKQLPDHRIESAVYPQYETSGELAQASQALLEWYGPSLLICMWSPGLTVSRVKGQVMELRKAHSETPWPPNDRDVGVVFVAHSMG